MNNLQVIAGRKMLLQVDDNLQDPLEWAALQKDVIDQYLTSEGALLVRGLEIHNSEVFSGVLTKLFGEALIEYTYRSTPRTKIVNNVYTATEYHPSEVIPQHNENAYSSSWPMRIGFLSMIVADKMGNTPLSDSREAYNRIPAEIRDEFERKKIMYVRNYSSIDLPWNEVFQTDDKSEVEKYCEDHSIRFEWTENGLRTSQVNDAVLQHPVSGDKLWFNQAHLFHVSSLSEELKEGLVALIGEENLPRNVYFGDGSRIDEAIVEKIREVYDETKFSFQWQKGDLLLLDNMLFTHGREPYEGSRRVLVGMAREYKPVK